MLLSGHIYRILLCNIWNSSRCADGKAASNGAVEKYRYVRQEGKENACTGVWHFWSVRRGGGIFAGNRGIYSVTASDQPVFFGPDLFCISRTCHCQSNQR